METIGRLSNIGRGRRGAASIEFALVAPLFMLLICILLDTALMLFAQGVLDNAVRIASRPIETGSSTVTATSFDAALCGAASPLMPCGKLSFYVNSTSTTTGFSALSTQAPNSSGYLSCTNISGSNNFNSCGFTPGSATSLVLVQVAFNRTYLLPWLSRIAGGTSTPAVVSTFAFQNEAY